MRASVDWSGGCGKWEAGALPWASQPGRRMGPQIQCLSEAREVCVKPDKSKTFLTKLFALQEIPQCFSTFIVSLIPDKEDTITILIFLITKIEFLVLVSGTICPFTMKENHV